MFSFTPLLGARSSSPAIQSLLEFDGGIKILVDVGWDTRFDAEALKELERQVPTISIVLLTHATLSHVGAYAHCCKHIPLFNRIPVYATTPVIALSRTLLQDLYVSTPLASSFLPTSSIAESAYTASSAASERTNILLPPPTPEEITDYFALANQLNYLQPHQPLPSPFSPPLDGLTITAYSAGHSLGGTIWQIQHGSESVVYAVDWHQGRENVFPGAAWISGAAGAEVVEPLRQPTALICSSKGADASGGRQQRDEQLLSKVRDTINNGGNVLIPSDSSARVLEIVYLLDRAWGLEEKPDAPESLRKARLYLASSTASATMRYARSMLEWMDDNIRREFDATSAAQPNQGKLSQPFEFKYLKMLEKKSSVERALSASGSKVIIASDSSLEWGMSRHLLDAFVAHKENLVLLTNPALSGASPDAALSSKLQEVFRRTSETNELSSQVVQIVDDAIEVRQTQTSSLAGNDLSIYQQYLARQRQRMDTTSIDKGTTTIETSADAVDERSESSSSSDEESDTEHQGRSMNISAALTTSKSKLGLTDDELGINILVRRKNVHDFDVRGKKGRDKMFPFVAKRRRNDDFGDLIRPEEYLRAEERDDVDGQDLGADANKTSLGHKRKWADTELDALDGKKKSLSSAQRRRKSKGGGQAGSHVKANGATSEAEESEEESDYEPAEAIVREPMNATVARSSLSLKMKLSSMDFAGIHDQRSLQMLIPLIKPRKLILTGGTDEQTSSLAETSRMLLASRESGDSKADVEVVFAPKIGELIDASVDTNAWTIKLSQTLFRNLQWQTIRSLGIVTLNGRLELANQIADEVQDHDAKRQKTEPSQEPVTKFGANDLPLPAMPVLNDLPINLGGTTRLANQPLHVGDLRLAELRKIMQANGHTAEFKGEGTLLVDGLVAVRKSGIGKIEIEGGGLAMPGASARQPDASFGHVKKKIYEGLALVAAR